MEYHNSFSKSEYAWNNAYNYVMLLKERYINQFGKLDTFDIRKLAEQLSPSYSEYANFLNCLDIHVQGSLNTFHYSLIKGGNIDLYTNEHSIYRELRGTVIDMEENELINCPFRKFFNINERYTVNNDSEEKEYEYVKGCTLEEVQRKLKNAKKIEITDKMDGIEDIDLAKALELVDDYESNKEEFITDKMDGSMHSARYYKDDIVYASSLTSNRVLSYRLAEGFTWLTNNHKQMIKDNPYLTFIFEYISLKDVHTVTYKEEQQGLYLIGIRDVTNGKQWFYSDVKEMAKRYDVQMVKVENTSLDDILKNRESFEGTEKEGWVLNIDGELYKLKTDGYIQLAKILTMLSSPKVLIHKIADDELDDFLTYLPKDAVNRIMPSINKIKEYREKLLTEIEHYYSIAPKESRKDYALYINKNVPSYLKKYMFLKLDGVEFNVLKLNDKYMKTEEIFGKNYQCLYNENIYKDDL